MRAEWNVEDEKAFFEVIKEMKWVASRSYKPAFAHEYSLFPNLPFARRVEVKRLFVRLFQRYGKRGWFGDKRQVYLDAPDGNTYWFMVRPVEEEVLRPDVVVINREPTCKRDRSKRGWRAYFATLDLDCGG